MEAQIEFKKWLDAEIDRVKGLSESDVLEFEERIEYFNQVSALMSAKIKLQELELEETNQQIESIIEEGRKSETLCEEINHNAKEKANGL